ncbi:MAG: TetR/AcrR family transcriptional regulator [bacterium]|nr:TetR/AcrR family transcriptional regulator [bacterium]
MTIPSPDSPKARRRRDPKATRTAILDAAEELFVDFGPADTPTSKIARRAGVTKSLIHHHFGSKEDLWGEVKRRHFGRYYEAQKQMLADAQGSLEMLRESVITFFRFLQSDPRSVRFMSWRFLEQDDPCLDLEAELFELGMCRIQEAQERGELRSDVEPISMIKSFLAMALHWFQSKPFLCQILGPEVDPDALDEQYLEDLVRIFLEGVRPR